MGKTTNKLLAIASAATHGELDRALLLLEDLRAFHLKEAAGLALDAVITGHFAELEAWVRGLAVMGELTPRATDAISALGERLSSLVVAAAFRECGMEVAHVDSRSVIVTDRRHTQAAPLFAQTYARLQTVIPALAATRVVVMGGFIAATEDGVTSTLGRGGSDYTASIVGRCRWYVDGRSHHFAGRPSREGLFVRRGRGTGLLRRQGAASGDCAARD
jgi:aspartate kinase